MGKLSEAGVAPFAPDWLSVCSADGAVQCSKRHCSHCPNRQAARWPAQAQHFPPCSRKSPNPAWMVWPGGAARRELKTSQLAATNTHGRLCWRVLY